MITLSETWDILTKKEWTTVYAVINPDTFYPGFCFEFKDKSYKTFYVKGFLTDDDILHEKEKEKRSQRS